MAFGNEFQVNTYTTWQQVLSQTTTLANGDFVITWQSNGQDGSGGGIYAQRYSSNGTPLGSELQINTFSNQHQAEPSITALADGGFAIAWQSLQGNTGYSVYAQYLNADGTFNGNEFLIDEGLAFDQRHIEITGLQGGGISASWTSWAQDGSGNGVYARRFDANGAPIGGEGLVPTITIDGQEHSSIMALSNGGYLITWDGIAANEWDIFGQFYDQNGAAVGTNFTINSHTANRQKYSDITELNDGGIVVVWQSTLGSSLQNYGVFAQIYNADGSVRGGEFKINTTSSVGQLAPDVVALSGGGFAVTWTGDVQDGNGNAVMVRSFEADGTATSPEQIVNAFTTGPQENSSITALDQDRFVVSWTSHEQDGEAGGIFARIFEPDPTCNEILGTDQSDIINGTADDDCIMGLQADDFINGNAGNDTIEGNDGYDEISGGSGRDLLKGGRKIDHLWGDEGRDTLYGGKGNDVLEGGSYRDKLYGNKHDDTLRGGSGDDFLSGGTGNDILLGQTGEDTLKGGQDDDVLYGGNGADVFVFDTGAGNDTVIDFEDGLDLLKFNGGAASFADLTLTQNGVNTEISYGAEVIVLLNVQTSEIQAADVLF